MRLPQAACRIDKVAMALIDRREMPNARRRLLNIDKNVCRHGWRPGGLGAVWVQGP